MLSSDTHKNMLSHPENSIKLEKSPVNNALKNALKSRMNERSLEMFPLSKDGSE